jgi:hypothetical protein
VTHCCPVPPVGSTSDTADSRRSQAGCHGAVAESDAPYSPAMWRFCNRERAFAAPRFPALDSSWVPGVP